MTSDACRLCDLTSFVWVGLADASGMDKLNMRKAVFCIGSTCVARLSTSFGGELMFILSEQQVGEAEGIWNSDKLFSGVATTFGRLETMTGKPTKLRRAKAMMLSGWSRCGKPADGHFALGTMCSCGAEKLWGLTGFIRVGLVDLMLYSAACCV